MSMRDLRGQDLSQSQEPPSSDSEEPTLRESEWPGKMTRTARLRRPDGPPIQRRADPAATPAPIDAPLYSLFEEFGGAGAPVQRKQSGSSDMHADAPAPPRGGGAPLPESVRDQMEQSFAADFSSVRIHEGPQAAAIGATAFTQGEQIHFAPGAYDPSGPAGLELLGHELAHVVQQRAGRVSVAQAHGADLVNADASLEAEADRAGARAARGQAAGIAGGGAPARAEAAPIQCNLGIEIEIGGGDGWRVYWGQGRGPVDPTTAPNANPRPADRAVAKGTPIVSGDGFQLQAEDNGAESTIEFVTNPPGMRTREQFDATMGGIAALGQTLAGKNNRPRFNATKIGGSNAFELQPGYMFTGSMQATMGVPLSCIPTLYRELSRIGCEGGQEYANAADQAEARGNVAGASPELIGFLTLLRHYISQGTGTNQRSFPKGIFKVMARTDFNAMFNMLPPHERQVIVNNMQTWIDLVCAEFDDLEEGGPGYDETQPLLNQSFSYDETKQSAPYRITTTREDWLTDMPQRDRMTRTGRDVDDVEVATGYVAPNNPMNNGTIGGWTNANPQAPNFDVSQHGVAPGQILPAAEAQRLESDIRGLYEGIGAYGTKTDAVRYQGAQQDTQAVLLEIRNPPTAGGPGNWVRAATNLFEAMDNAIRNPQGSQQPTGYQSVETDGQRRMREAQELEENLKAMIARVGKRVKKSKKTDSTGFHGLPSS
jgi:uncharacterized protein DUF4157